MSPGHIKRVNKMYRQGGLEGLRKHAHITSPMGIREPAPVPLWGRVMSLVIVLSYVAIMLSAIQHTY